MFVTIIICFALKVKENINIFNKFTQLRVKKFQQVSRRLHSAQTYIYFLLFVLQYVIIAMLPRKKNGAAHLKDSEYES